MMTFKDVDLHLMLVGYVVSIQFIHEHCYNYIFCEVCFTYSRRVAFFLVFWGFVCIFCSLQGVTTKLLVVFLCFTKMTTKKDVARKARENKCAQKERLSEIVEKWWQYNERQRAKLYRRRRICRGKCLRRQLHPSKKLWTNTTKNTLPMVLLISFLNFWSLAQDLK